MHGLLLWQRREGDIDCVACRVKKNPRYQYLAARQTPPPQTCSSSGWLDIEVGWLEDVEAVAAREQRVGKGRVPVYLLRVALALRRTGGRGSGREGGAR